MADFNVIELNNSPYDYLLIATSFRSSLNDFTKLNRAMNIEEGKVLFDFLLIHGNKKNRFVECRVIDTVCERQSIKVADQVDYEIRKKSSLYFRENENLIQNSVLPKALQYLITTGNLI